MLLGPGLDYYEATKLRKGQFLIRYSRKSKGATIRGAAGILGMELDEHLGFI